MKFSLQRFFIIAIFTVFSCGCVTIGILWYYSKFISHTIENLTDSVESAASTQLIQRNLSLHRRQVLLKGLRSEDERKIQTEAAKKNLLLAINNLPRFATSSEEQMIASHVGEKIKAYLSNYERLRNSDVSAIKLYNSVNEDAFQAQEAIQDLMRYNLEEAKRVQLKISEQNKINYTLAFSAFFLLSIALGVVLLGIRKYFYHPIVNLKNLIENFKVGESFRNKSAQGSTEIQAIASSFNILSEKLSKQKEMQLTFLASIAHDLKNPLSAIKMSLELIDEDAALSIQSKQMIAIIDRQANHLMTLITDLLDTTRIESGNMKITLSPVDIGKVINDSAALHSNLSRIHEIIINLPRYPVIVLSDEERLSQVFNNLFNNAIKYSPNGGKISANIFASDNFATIELVDSGVGILQVDIEGIFEPFRRSSTTRYTIPGIGLGLSVARKIIRAHEGGDIRVSSQPGAGTTFSVILPIFKRLPVAKNIESAPIA